MKKIKLIIFCMFVFNIFIININAENVNCFYKREKGSCFGQSFYEDLYADEGVFQATINIEQDNKLQDYFFSKPVRYYNNTNSSGNRLMYGGQKVSAVEYYQNTGGTCPPYIGIQDGSGNEMEVFFIDEKESKNAVYLCVFPRDKIKYDEDFNRQEEIYSCNLYSSDNTFEDVKVNVSINYTKKTITFNNEPTESKWKSALDEYKKNYDFSKKEKCPVNELKICGTLDILSVVPKNYDVSDTCISLDSSKKIKIGDTYCGAFVNYARKIKNNENISQNTDYLKQLCNSVFKYEDYNDDKSSCINLCLNINNYIPDITLKEGECGFTQKLTLFIANIIKWVKYIIPVVAIVLSILEFIKAVGADKDDEMKKAQGNFVKRMIAAALIFIVPVIIEFVLDSMGFNVNGCGIIDL